MATTNNTSYTDETLLTQEDRQDVYADLYKRYYHSNINKLRYLRIKILNSRTWGELDEILEKHVVKRTGKGLLIKSGE